MHNALRGAVAAVMLVALTARAAPDYAAIDAYVQAQVEAHGIPGLALAIVHDGRPVHLRGFGVTGPKGEPVTPRTPFLLGALSQTLTAAVVMQLVEAGRLELDAPVQRYLPWFRLADVPASAAITVRHLLQHTSGIPPTAAGSERPRPKLEDHVRALAGVWPTATPGERHQEAPLNYVVLGLLVEHLSGEPFAASVERHLFRRLALESSFTSAEAARTFGLASGYRLWAGTPLPVQRPFAADLLPATALISSAEDLARVLVAQMVGRGGKGGPLLSPSSLAALHAPAALDTGFSSAMGWRVGTTAGVPTLWRGGALPGYSAALVLQPEERWGVVVLTNLGTALEDPARLIAQGVTARLVGATPPVEGLPLRKVSQLAVGAVAVPTLMLLWRLLRLDRWRDRVTARLAAPERRPRLLLRLGVDVLLPTLVLTLLPHTLGVPLGALYEGAPDLTAGLVLMVGVGALLVLVRLRLASTLRMPPAPERASAGPER